MSLFVQLDIKYIGFVISLGLLFGVWLLCHIKFIQILCFSLVTLFYVRLILRPSLLKNPKHEKLKICLSYSYTPHLHFLFLICQGIEISMM